MNTLDCTYLPATVFHGIPLVWGMTTNNWAYFSSWSFKNVMKKWTNYLIIIEPALFLFEHCKICMYRHINMHMCLYACQSLNHVQFFLTPRIMAHKTPLSMEFSKQEYCSGLPFPLLGDLPDPSIELGSPALQADSLPTKSPGERNIHICKCILYTTNRLQYFKATIFIM